MTTFLVGLNICIWLYGWGAIWSGWRKIKTKTAISVWFPKGYPEQMRVADLEEDQAVAYGRELIWTGVVCTSFTSFALLARVLGNGSETVDILPMAALMVVTFLKLIFEGMQAIFFPK